VYIHKPRTKGYHLLQDVNVVSLVSPTHERHKKSETAELKTPFFAQSPINKAKEQRRAEIILRQRQSFHSGIFNRASTGRR